MIAGRGAGIYAPVCIHIHGRRLVFSKPEVPAAVSLVLSCASSPQQERSDSKPCQLLTEYFGLFEHLYTSDSLGVIKRLTSVSSDNQSWLNRGHPKCFVRKISANSE